MNMMAQQDDHEAAMARADLYKLANYSFKLFKMIQDGDQLEGWVQAKVTKAADYIASVFHFMEYEMKFSEYGKRLETSDVYTESVKREYMRKLTEARVKLEKLREKNINDLSEGKDDERGGDDDTPGKFNVKSTSTGTRYTRKSKTFSDEPEKKVSKAAPTGAERRAEKSKDTSQADSKNWQARFGKGSVTRHTPSDKEPASKVKEGSIQGGVWTADAPKKGAPNVPVPSPDEGPTTNVKKPVAPVKKPVRDVKPVVAPVKEALKGGQKKLDVDKDGKLEKSDFAKLRASKGVKEAEDKKCNHTPKGKSCPLHGLKECGPMEGLGRKSDKNIKEELKGDMHPEAHKVLKHIKPEHHAKYKPHLKAGYTGKYADRAAVLDAAERAGHAKKVKESLKGGQKKLDVDKDGKLEKSDFAKLRASKDVKESLDLKRIRETMKRLNG